MLFIHLPQTVVGGQAACMKFSFESFDTVLIDSQGSHASLDVYEDLSRLLKINAYWRTGFYHLIFPSQKGSSLGVNRSAGGWALQCL